MTTIYHILYHNITQQPAWEGALGGGVVPSSNNNDNNNHNEYYYY